MPNLKSERENPPFKPTTKPTQPFSGEPQFTLQKFIFLSHQTSTNEQKTYLEVDTLSKVLSKDMPHKFHRYDNVFVTSECIHLYILCIVPDVYSRMRL